MKKFLILLIAFMAGLTTMAQEVSYINANGVEATLANGSYTAFTSDQTTLADGWWVVSGQHSVSSRIAISGVVHLVLADGASLTATQGITLEGSNELHIYGQQGSTGVLTATGNVAQAGIGGLTHNTGGTLVVNGGNIIATGGSNAAGIGGGSNGNWAGAYGHGGTFIINGGTVTATGNSYGAGIGGGGYNAGISSPIRPGNGGVAIFNGGHVIATGGANGYGVGPGKTNTYEGDPTTLTLNWTKGDEAYYISSASANVDINAPFYVAGSGEVVTEDNFTGDTIKAFTEGVHTVNFLVDGAIYKKSFVTDSSTVVKPTDPAVAGKAFVEWQLGGKAYDFTTPVTDDITLNAKFRDLNIQVVDGVYQIGSANDWKEFSIVLLTEPGANAALTANVTLGSDAPMLGSASNMYGGTFDGQNHTLKVNYTNNTIECTAPFLYADGATFRDLTVSGTITTDQRYAAGFVSQSYGATFTNCVSSVTISSSVNGEGTHGGFVGVARSNATEFTGCVFDGRLQGSSTNGCGGFVGWRSATVNLSSCLFAPDWMSISTSDCHTFCRHEPTSSSNCYYTVALGGSVGSFVARILADDRVTISGTPNITHKGVDYYTGPATLTLNYDLPDGKFFNRYTVTSGTISNATVMTGEHVLSDFTRTVTISGSHVDNKIDIATTDVDDIADITYDRREHEPALTITNGSDVLVKDFDYQTTYTDNVNAGQATVIITGIGVYGGERTINFNILPRDLNDGITANVQQVVAEGTLPEATLTFGDYTLVQDTDYTMDLSTHRYYKITGKGNYTGIIEGSYTEVAEVTYLEYNAEDNTFTSNACTNYNLIYQEGNLNEGWWVVAEDFTLNSRITCTGDVKLIIKDGVTLNVNGGINVGSGSNFTVYAQSDGDNMGRLVINDVSKYEAGIGGNHRQEHGVITINGGDVTVEGGNSGAGIGSGADMNSTSPNSYIYIHGGKVNATGGNYSAAIGGGDFNSGGHIVITGGEVNAIGGEDNGGAGIGGSDGYSALEILISGGIINATGGGKSAGIGGGGYWASVGDGGQSGTITITGGQISATPGTNCSTAIGAGATPVWAGDTDVITLGWTDGMNDFITANGNYETGSVVLAKTFALESTTTLATPDNIAHNTIVPVAIVTIAENMEHGTVTADKEVVALSGERTVTLTVLPENGYELESLTVAINSNDEPAGGAPKRVSGGTVELTPGSEPNTYTFTMPDEPVTVNATFTETVVTGIEDINATVAKTGQRYNLQGQPVGKDYKGLVVEDGKKILVK